MSDFVAIGAFIFIGGRTCKTRFNIYTFFFIAEPTKTGYLSHVFSETSKLINGAADFTTKFMVVSSVVNHQVFTNFLRRRK